MLDNLFTVTFQKLDSQSCNAMADYLEAQASMLRRRADNEEAQNYGRRDRIKQANIAGLDALNFYRSGMNKVSACAKSATQNAARLVVVEAIFKSLLDSEMHQQREESKNHIIRMRKKGKKLREISSVVGISEAQISRILKKHTLAIR